MRILNFIAKNVHDYLNFNIEFRPDVNFLLGLNGSGKTTAIRMIMALLTPNFKELNRISFKSCKIKLVSGNNTYDIICIKESAGPNLILLKDEQYIGELSANNMINSRSRKTKNGKYTSSDYALHPVIKELDTLIQPMFLSLDRRVIQTSKEVDDDFKTINAHIASSRFRNHHSDSHLNNALELISTASAIARNKNAALDKSLRDEIMLSSLALSSRRDKISYPNKIEVSRLLEKHNKISTTLKGLNINTTSVDESYNEFFERMFFLAEKAENVSAQEHSPKLEELLFEWVINQDKLTRIDNLSKIVENYEKRKRQSFTELSKFELLVNNFLSETGKEIVISTTNEPKIKINGKTKDITFLSSGETQIIIMLAQLILNRDLPKDGVLIIDEPEVSLHISWQDMFVEALQAANPNLQMILATHSPAIIGGRNAMYVPLNKDYQ